LNYKKISNNPKQFKALTSLSIEEFDELLSVFSAEWTYFIEKYNLDGSLRLRKYVPKAQAQLATPAEKLFFILYLFKNNPLQEALAASFDLSQDMANKWVHILTAIFEKATKSYKIERSAAKIDHQLSAYDTYIADATERPIQRDSYEQQHFYSGKKKMHTLKNLLIISLSGLILYLSPTVEGKCHDKPLGEALAISKPITLLADLAFYGFKPTEFSLFLPHKKPKNKELTKIQKTQNKLLSRERVKVEHVLAHVKVLRIIKDKNRNYKLHFRDTIMNLACRLHNFRLKHRITRNTFYS
jgi:hypothetical protein